MDTEPTKPRSWHIDVWLDPDVYERIRDQSERENCSIGEIVRRAVTRAMMAAEG